MIVFLLDGTKLNEIIYNMENQSKNSLIKIDSGEILYPTDSSDIENSNLYPLPKWGPVDGFRVMNEFVSELKNPIVKQELRQVLNQGHGVFRKFKNVLKGSPEIERMWYSFKRDEIKTKVINWYNQILDYAGLELYNEDDFDDEEDLLDFDFTINKGEELDYDFVLSSDKIGFYELYSNYPLDIIDEIYTGKRDGMLNESMFSSDFVYVAKTPSGDRVGFIWAASFSLGSNFSGMDLLQLFVIPEYRGLGIGKMLINKIISDYRSGDFKDLIVNCQGNNSWLITYLELEGYKVAFQELSFRL